MFHVCQHAKRCNRKGKIKGDINLSKERGNCRSHGKLLSRGYSSVHTRLEFDTEMFTPKGKECLNEKNQIVDDLRNLYGEND